MTADRLRDVAGLPATLAVTMSAFAGFSLLLAVVPLALSLAGGSDALAGAATAVFMGATVLAQIGAPRALRAWGYRPTLALGCALLGLPALVLVATIAPVPTLLVSAVRGIGFGLLTVTGSALVAELVPPRLLGRATGTFGAAAAGPQIVALPGGVALAQSWSTTPVFLLGALIPTLAAVGTALVPPVRTHPAPDESGTRVSLRALAVPLLALLVVASAYGGITSLLPIAIPSDAGAATIALAVLSAATVAGRYASGVVANRVAAGRQLLPALTCAVVGLVLVAFAVRSPVLAVVLAIGALCVGAGFGVCQNDSLVTVFHRTDPHQRGSASAAWNIAFDGGTGAGALAMGVLATGLGYPWAFVAAAAAVALVVPAAWRLARAAS